jgi:hypothetical protein
VEEIHVLFDWQLAISARVVRAIQGEDAGGFRKLRVRGCRDQLIGQAIPSRGRWLVEIEQSA